MKEKKYRLAKTRVVHSISHSLFLAFTLLLVACSEDNEYIKEGPDVADGSIAFSANTIGAWLDGDRSRAANGTPNTRSSFSSQKQLLAKNDFGLLLECEVDTVVNEAVTRSANNEDYFTIGKSVIGLFARYGQGGNYKHTCPDFMYNIPLELKSGGWEYSPKRYWPNKGGDVMEFFAYYPHEDSDENYYDGNSSVKQITVSEATADEAVTFTLKPDGKTDILLTPDPVQMSKPANNEKVNLQFAHVLGEVTVNLTAHRRVTVSGFTFKNVVGKQATYTYPGGTLSDWTLSKDEDGNEKSLTDLTFEEKYTIGNDDGLLSKGEKHSTAYTAYLPEGTEIQHFTIIVEGVPRNISLESPVSIEATKSISLSITIPNDANSYILNKQNAIFRIPINRINEFWNNSTYAANPEIKIRDETEWVAEVIWQDIPHEVITFVNHDGTETSDTGSKIYTGNTAFYVKLNIDPSTEDYRGNILVGVRKTDDSELTYLWSWHLWVTDYDPDAIYTDVAQSKWGDNYAPGNQTGAIHRYAPANGYTLWNDNGFYKDKYIMDRNLGAKSTEFDSTYKNGMYYQFGRKDPFPYYDIYNWDGTNIAAKLGGSKNEDHIPKVYDHVTMSETVMCPYRYYYTDGGRDAKNTITDCDNSGLKLWNDMSLPKESKDKSIFDPSPLGWKIPKKGTFEIAKSRNIQTKEDYSVGLSFYIASEGNESIAFIPGARSRSYSGGIIYPYISSTEDNSVYLWYADDLKGEGDDVGDYSTATAVAGCYECNKISFNMDRTHAKAFAFPVRPIME